MWVAVEGLIGAGKTTTATVLSESGSRFTSRLEPSEVHSFLDDYYADPPRYVVETEIQFMLLQRHQVLKGDPSLDYISDYAPAKNLVFAELVADPTQLEFLKLVDTELWSDMRRPDLAVLLDVPVDVCLSRIASRGRPYEAGITAGGLRRLQSAYRKSSSQLGDEVRVLELRGTESPEEVAEEVAALAA
jgi:deoxyguanosine kinase